jgi:predicted ribosome quality control (RQC) complex YloA/Tae2 family protein
VLRLAELRRAARALDARLAGLRLEKLAPAGELRVLLRFEGRPAEGGARVRRHVLVTCAPGSARVSELEAAPAGEAGAPAGWPLFFQLLRARVLGARFAGARILGDDRQLALRLEGAEGASELLLSILGGRSNVYLLDAEGRVDGWLRPLDATLRGLARGAPFRGPPSAAPAEGEDRFAGVPEHALLAAIEAHYAREEATHGAEDLARRIETALAREASSLARKEAALRADVAAGGDPDAEARAGELLKLALREVRPGATQVTVRDPASGEAVEVELDPALSPARNLERHFQRARKARRRAERAATELGALAARAEALAAQREALAALRAATPLDVAALEALAAGPPLSDLLSRRERGALAPAAAPPRPKPGPFDDLPARLRPRRYRSHDGLEIWVGRSDEGNDHLSTRLARGNDVFLHVGAAGSHVVLRTEGRRDAPQESLLEACELAVHFSKLRGAGRAPVLVAACKDVSKPRGAKPGLVHVRGGRELVLRHEPARLSRVLAARIEDPRARFER